MNKNISVWRGNKTPPTNYHIWVKDNKTILIFNPLSKTWDNILSLLSLEDIKLLDNIQQLISISNSKLEELSSKLDELKDNTYSKSEIDEKINQIHITGKFDLQDGESYSELTFNDSSKYDSKTRSQIVKELTIHFPKVSTWGYKIKLLNNQLTNAHANGFNYNIVGKLIAQVKTTDNVYITFDDPVNIVEISYWQIVNKDKLSEMINDVEYVKNYIEDEVLFIIN